MSFKGDWGLRVIDAFAENDGVNDAADPNRNNRIASLSHHKGRTRRFAEAIPDCPLSLIKADSKPAYRALLIVKGHLLLVRVLLVNPADANLYVA